MGCHHRTHVSDMLSILQWLNVRQIFHLLTGSMMYNIVTENTLTYINIDDISHKSDNMAKQFGNIFQTHSHNKSLKSSDTTL